MNVLGIRALITGGSLLLLSCGSGSNFNQLFTNSKAKERADIALKNIELTYDAGEFQQVIDDLATSTDLVRMSEKGVQFKAFAELALGGFDLFDIVKKIVTESGKTSTSSSSSASASLDKLSVILDLSEEDILKLATLDSVPVSENSIIGGIDVYVPNEPGVHTNPESPRAKVDALRYVNQAIATICPFISEELRKVGDTVPAGSRYECTPSTAVSNNPTSNLVIFGLAHMIETLAFNIVLVYNPDGSSLTETPSTPLLARITALQAVTPGVDNFGEYLGAVSRVTQNVTATFDIEGDSMLAATLLDLKKTSAAFAAIPGMPDSVKKGINSATDVITNAAGTAAESTEGLAKQTEALKQDLGGSVLSGLDSSVGALIDGIDDYKAQGNTLSETEKADIAAMCDSLPDSDKCVAYRAANP